MSIPPLSTLQGYMKNVTDKRQPGKIRHKLEDMGLCYNIGQRNKQ